MDNLEGCKYGRSKLGKRLCFTRQCLGFRDETEKCNRSRKTALPRLASPLNQPPPSQLSMKERIKLRLKEKGLLDHLKNILNPQAQLSATRSAEPQRKERKRICTHGMDPVTLKCIKKKRPTKGRKPCTYGIDPVTLKCLKKRKQKRERSHSEEDDLIPYDSRTGNPIPDEIDIDDPSVKDFIQWRDLKGRIVDVSGDVALGFGELKSDKKKKEANKVKLKFVPEPYGGILTANEEEFKCFRKGEVPTQLGQLKAASPRQATVLTVSVKKRPNLENTSEELKKELKLTTDKSIKISKYNGVDYMYNEENSNERIPVQFSENIWRKIS